MTRVVRFIILLLRAGYSFVSAIQRMLYDIKRNTWLLAYSLRNVTLHFETKALARDRAIVLSSDCPSSMTTVRFNVFLSFSFFILQSRYLILFFERRPKYLWIISSSHLLIRRWLRTMNEEETSLRGSILPSDSIMTTWLINIPDYVPSRHLFFQSVPSDLTANYNPPALLYERQIRRPFHFLLPVLNTSSRSEVIMAWFHL